MRRAAFTLVELLTALALAVMIFAMVYGVYAAVQRTRLGQRERTAGPAAASAALEGLRGDLSGLFLSAADSNAVLRLEPAEADGSSSLAFCTVRPGTGEVDLRWADAVAVRWAAEPADGRLVRLVRIERPLAGPASLQPAHTNVVLADIDAFTARVFDGKDWQTAWPPAAGETPPRAVRLDIQSARFPGRKTWTADVLLPSGQTVTSTLTRTTGGR